MLAQEWDWNKYVAVNVQNAAQETEKRVRAEFEAVVADKDAALAGKDAEIEALKAKLKAQQKQ